MPLRWDRSDGTAVVRVGPRLDRSVAERAAPVVREALAAGARRVVIDCSTLEAFDSAGVADLVGAVREARGAGADVRFRGAGANLRETLSLVSLEPVRPPGDGPPPDSRLERVGELSLPFLRAVFDPFRLLFEALRAVVLPDARGRRVRVERLRSELAAVGADAFPIVALIAFLMGLILAMQANAQLRQFGASIYVANLVGVSLTREIGPFLTAVLVAGRTGSAYAAELGTRVVSEEVDAIRQMGLDPLRFLVVPKVLALAIALPCLVVFADALGILGGTVLAVASLGLPARVYLAQTRDALFVSDLTTGLVKSLAFGLLIAAVGCSQGLAVRGGAGGVGRATTTAVVVSIFLVIVADALFTAIFQGV